MKIKKIVLILLCFFVILTSAFGQESDDWYYDKEIVDIEFIGLKSISELDLDSVVSSFIGESFSDEVYIAVLNRIYALEYFEDIVPLAVPANAQRNEVILQFTVVEKPVISQLLFSGNSKMRSGELRNAISIKENDIFVESDVIVDERKIRDLYFQNGFTNIKISSETTETDEGIKVVFLIDEGRETVIGSILFQGNTVASEQTLERNLQLKETSLFQKGAFQETTLEQDKQVLAAFYQTRGYIDVVIEDVVRESTYNTDKDRDELTLTFIINEGSQYTFGGITLEGNVVFSSEEITSLLSLNEGDVFNQLRFQEGLTAIADLYYENGYTANNFTPDVTRDTQNNIVSCVLRIIERPRSHIESISIVGNDKTQDYVILRELPLVSGDIFSKRKIETGLRSLYNLQFFSVIVPEIVQGSEENLIDIVINVEEQSTVGLEFGLTFSGITDPDSWPVSLFTTWSDKNFLGTGRSISANIKGSNDEQSVSFNYGDSWFLGQPVNFNAGFYVEHVSTTTPYNNYLPTGVNTTDYYMDYNQLSFGLNAALGKRWVWDFATITTTGGLANSFVQNFYDSELYEPVDTVISDRVGKFGIENSLYVRGSLDARDLSYDPSKGWFASQQFTWTGLIPTIESEYFFSTDTKGEIYFTLLDLPVSEIWNLKFVLAAYTNFSFLVPVSDSPIGSDSLFSIDGMFNGRGWGQSGGFDQSYDIEGQAMWSSFVELRMPIAPGVFSLDFFMDVIAIKDTPQDFFTGLTSNDFYYSFGPGMRFSLPQFPLRLLWTWSYKFENGQFEWNSQTGNRGLFVLSFNLTNQ